MPGIAGAISRFLKGRSSMESIFDRRALLELARNNRDTYANNEPFPHIMLDNFLPEKVAEQNEVGVASSMGAAGVAYMMGGTTRSSIQAAALALLLNRRSGTGCPPR